MTKTKTSPTLPTMVLPEPTLDSRFDKRAVGWELIENVSLEGEPTLALDTFLFEGESNVVGYTMLERSKEGTKKKGASAGQFHAERMLEHQDKIPVEWRKFYLVFTGTVWRRPDGDLFVPFLFWGGARWHMDWSSLGNYWRDFNRLVCLGK